jgi:phosphoglycolate phosphatase-like HAD superfamily hydrolase
MKLFVWDFHGVLEKDNDLDVLYLSNIVLKNNGHSKRFSLSEANQLSGLKWYEYFEYLLPELSHEEHLRLQADCLDYQRKNRETVHKYLKPNNYADHVLGKIKKAGHDQLLISNTNLLDLVWFVERVGLRKYFDNDRLVGINSHQRKSNKNDAFREFLQGKEYDRIVVIGDSQKDIDLKLVGGGTAYYFKRPNRESGSINGADFKIDNLKEVLKEI